jgi:hypothetical protein
VLPALVAHGRPQVALFHGAGQSHGLIFERQGTDGSPLCRDLLCGVDGCFRGYGIGGSILHTLTRRPDSPGRECAATGALRPVGACPGRAGRAPLRERCVHGSRPPGRCALPQCRAILGRWPAGEAAPAKSLPIRAAPALQGRVSEELPHQPATVPYRACASGSSSHSVRLSVLLQRLWRAWRADRHLRTRPCPGLHGLPAVRVRRLGALCSVASIAVA